jgi:ceramide glucosyltransferase
LASIFSGQVLNWLGLLAAAFESWEGRHIETHENKQAMAPLKHGGSGWLTHAGGALSGPVPLLLRLASILGAGESRRLASYCALAGSLITRYEAARSMLRMPLVLRFRHGCSNVYNPRSLATETSSMIARALMLVAVGGLFTSTLFLLLAIAGVLRFRGKQLPACTAELPPVTLLKPVHGAEPQLRTSLESFFRLDYPKFEIVFGARNLDDPALAIVRELMQAYPQVQVKVVASGEPPWPNAKCWSLVKMAEQASHHYLVISDSDVEVAPDYLRALIPPLLDPDVGCVTTVYRGKPADGFWARLEALGMSVEMTSGVLIADMLEGMKFALGPTMAVRREALDTIGGFSGFADYCSDDFLLGKWIADKGYTIQLSPHVIDHVVLHESMRQSFAHQARWMKSTRYSRPKGHLGMGLTFAMPYGVLGLLAGAASGSAALGATVFAAASLNRVVLSLASGWLALRDPRALAYCWLYPLRDLMGFGFWLHSYFSDQILWRGERYRLETGGRMVKLGT